MQKAFLAVRKIEFDLPGMTIGVAQIQHITEGWVVKLPEWQNLEGKEGMAEAFDIAAETTGTVSGYKSEETELWDVVEIYDDEDKATEAGKRHGQMTIYQIETGRLKWLN